jgi:hypothetical protein
LAQQFSFSASEIEHNMPGQEGPQCPQLLLNYGGEALEPEAHTALWWWLLHDDHAYSSKTTCTPDFFNAAGCACEVEGQQVVPPATSTATAAAAATNSRTALWTCDWPDGMSPAAAQAANFRMNVRIAAGVVTPWVFVFLAWRVYRSVGLQELHNTAMLQ